jgi:hypothetical protein
MIIYTTQQAAKAVLDEIMNVQDLPLYQVDAYFAEYNEGEADPEFTLEEIINVLRLVLQSELVYFVPGHCKLIEATIAIGEHGRHQEDIWHGDVERILQGIAYQWNHWEAFDQGYFVPKLKAHAQNRQYREKYGYDRFVFVEPTDDELKQQLKYEQS